MCWAKGGVTRLELIELTSLHDVEGVYHFLELTGASLTRLQLSSIDLGMNIARLRRACPSQEVLIIDVDVNTEALLTAYNENDTRIKELDFQFDNLSKVTAELTTTKSWFARTLKRLACTSTQDRSSVDEEHLETAAPMHAGNRTLEFLELTIPRHIFSLPTPVFRQFHNTSLPEARETFPSLSRLAFLSICGASPCESEQDPKRTRNEGMTSSPVVSAFPVDRRGMSAIFGFAAESVRLLVFVGHSQQDCDGDR